MRGYPLVSLAMHEFIFQLSDSSPPEPRQQTMNRPLTRIDQLAAATSADGGRLHKLEIHLEQQRAAGWLVCVEELSMKHTSPELRQFSEELSDACWLACWKREDPLLRVDLLSVPGLISALISDSAFASSRARIVEDIVSTLSACRTAP